MRYYSELPMTFFNEEDTQVLKFSSQFSTPESRLLNSLSIILELIDSKGRTLESESDATLLCLVIKEIERFCNMNQAFTDNDVTLCKPQFKTTAIFSLLHKILLTNDIAISLPALWCNTIYWLYSHLIYEFLFLKPINIIKQQFERSAPPMAFRTFGEQTMKNSIGINALVSKLETRNDLKYTFETVLSFVTNYIPKFNLDTANVNPETKLIRREQVKMFTCAFFCALDFAVVAEDSFIKTAALDSLYVFYKVLTNEERLVFLNIAGTVRESSIILNEEVAQLINNIELTMLN